MFLYSERLELRLKMVEMATELRLTPEHTLESQMISRLIFKQGLRLGERCSRRELMLAMVYMLVTWVGILIR